jgi:hypothetical protein
LSYLFEHRGYVGQGYFHADTDDWQGLVALDDARIGFEAPAEEGLERAFAGAVDDYLARCEAEGVLPEAPITRAQYNRGWGNILSPDEWQSIYECAKRGSGPGHLSPENKARLARRTPMETYVPQPKENL